MSLKVAAPTLVHTHSVINEEKRKTETSRETGKSEMGRLALKFVGRDRKCQERKDTETTSERKRHKEAGKKNATGEKTCAIMWEQESQITDYEPTLHSARAIRDPRPQTRKRENYTSSLFKSLLRKWGTSLSISLSPYLFSSLSSVRCGDGGVYVPSLFLRR